MNKTYHIYLEDKVMFKNIDKEMFDKKWEKK